MNLDSILDAKIAIEGDPLPTLRQIIEKHFIAEAGGNAAIGKIAAIQYANYLREFTPRRPAEDGKPRENESTAEASRKDRGAEHPFGLPLDAKGNVDLMAAIAGLVGSEAKMSPLGALLGALMKGVADTPSRGGK